MTVGEDGTIDNPITATEGMRYFKDKYYIDGGKIHIKRSDGIQAECEFSYKKYLDYISIMITQSNVDLTLDYSAEYANIKDSVRVDCEPLTLFTKLYFGAQYD